MENLISRKKPDPWNFKSYWIFGKKSLIPIPEFPGFSKFRDFSKILGISKKMQKKNSIKKFRITEATSATQPQSGDFLSAK